MASQYEVLGIGAPIIDYIIEVSEEFIVQIPGQKGGMVVVDYQTIETIIGSVEKEPPLFLGGSGANTIRGLANFGHRCGFVGKVGRDAAGKKFLDGLEKLEIHTTHLLMSDSPTAQVICLITPDKERTMRAFLGASQEMRAEDLTPAMFEGVKLVHLEGYNLLNMALAQRTMELAKAAGVKISFDMGSFEIVDAYREKIVELLSKYVDVVFANRMEAQMLTKLDPEGACKILRDLCETVVILLGKDGCLVGQRDEQKHYPAFPVEEPIDTTGAGDMFASGFLHGYLEDNSMEECARIGALAGAAVVQVQGVEIPPQDWDILKQKLKRKE